MKIFISNFIVHCLKEIKDIYQQSKLKFIGFSVTCITATCGLYAYFFPPENVSPVEKVEKHTHFNNQGANINQQAETINIYGTNGINKEQLAIIQELAGKLFSASPQDHANIITQYARNKIFDALSRDTLKALFGDAQSTLSDVNTQKESLIQLISKYIQLAQEVKSLKTQLPDMANVFNQAEILLKQRKYPQVIEIIESAKKQLAVHHKEYEKTKANLANTQATAAMLDWDFKSAAEFYQEAFYAVKSVDAKLAAQYLWGEGDAWYALGDKKGNNEALKKAIDMYKELIADYYQRDIAPLQWARTQVRLGNAYLNLDERESGTENVTKAIQAYQNALLERTRQKVPLDWAATQMNLGVAYSRLDEPESGTENVKKAIQAYQNALLENTRDKAPLDWAKTQVNLGNVYQTLGIHENPIQAYQNALQAYENALLEITRKKVPLDWATTQMNLGNAYRKLGILKNDTKNLTQAIQAYKNALSEQTRNKVPLQWSTTQMSLGDAYWILGARESGTENLTKAIQAYKNALLESTRDKVPVQWATIQMKLGDTYLKLGRRESGIRNLTKAIQAYENALLENTRDDCKIIHMNLMIVYSTLMLRESGKEKANLEKINQTHDNSKKCR